MIAFAPVFAFSFCRAVRQMMEAFVLNKGDNPMAANLVVKIKKGDSVTDLFDDLKQHFSQKGDDAKGELTAKVDGSVKIAYKVQGDNATFTVTQSPALFSDSDQKKMLQELFG